MLYCYVSFPGLMDFLSHSTDITNYKLRSLESSEHRNTKTKFSNRKWSNGAKNCLTHLCTWFWDIVRIEIIEKVTVSMNVSVIKSIHMFLELRDMILVRLVCRVSISGYSLPFTDHWFDRKDRDLNYIYVHACTFEEHLHLVWRLIGINTKWHTHPKQERSTIRCKKRNTCG